MLHIDFLPKNKGHLALSVVAILLTIMSITVISMSLEAAYLWLIIVLMMILFFTTFTCSNPQHILQHAVTRNSDNVVEVESENEPQPCWAIDVPPSYKNVTGLPTGDTPPPSYRKIHFPPELINKCEPGSNTDISRHIVNQVQCDNLPEVFSNNKTRHNSVSSIQTLNFSVIEGVTCSY